MASGPQEQSITRPAQTNHRETLATLTRAIFLVSLPFGILHFVLPIFGQQVGADAVQIGLFFSAFSLMTVLLRPVVGAGLDRYGRRPFFVAGLLGYALTMFTFAFSANVTLILLARTLQGTASALLWLAANAITADVAGENARGRAFGGIGQSNMAGSVVGTFIGFGVFLSMPFMDGWKVLFSGYGAVSLLVAWWAWRLLPETHVKTHHTSQPIVWSRDWVLLLLVTVVTGASAAMLAPIMMIFLQNKFSAGVEELAWASLPAALVGALFQTRLGRLADRFGRKPLMVLSMAAAAMTSFLIPGLNSLLQLAALWALQSVSYSAGDPAEQALVADLTGGDQRGRAYGLYAFAAGLGATVGPVAGGWLYETIGPQAPFLANGVVLGACTLVLLALLRVPSGLTAEIAE
jgi:DHA1 family multidrug resistance protein-like MFS transporter